MVTTWNDALLDELAAQGDPPVDDLLAAHAATLPDGPQRPAALVRAVAQHLQLPATEGSPGIQAYLHDAPGLPDWADERLLHRSAEFFKEYGLEIGAALFCASLPESYAAPRGAKVLALTGRLATDPVRRVYETAQMVLHVLTKHGLAPGHGHGYADARRVRLMHGAVRYLVANDPRIEHVAAEPVPELGWLDRWGLPLNQEDMFGGLLTFTVTTFETMEKLGVPASATDAEAFLHRWCVVAHLMGLRADLLPLGVDEARELAALIRRRQQGPTADGHLLATALAQALEGGLWLPLRGLVPATMRWFVGPQVATDLALPRSAWSWVLQGPLRELGVKLQLDAHHDRARRHLTKRWTAKLLHQFMASNRRGDRPTFAMPEELDPTFQLGRDHFRFLLGPP